MPTTSKTRKQNTRRRRSKHKHNPQKRTSKHASAPNKSVWHGWKARHIVYPTRNHLTLEELDKIPYVDENNAPIDIKHEREEQYVSHDYIHPNSTVLELGARYGVVSSVINNKLENPRNHVCVEPDSNVIGCLRKNRRTHKGHFHVVNGIVSQKPMGLLQKGYSSHMVPVDAKTPAVKSYSVEELQNKHKLKFDTLVADCEGCLCAFVDENPTFVFNQLKHIMFEADWPNKCDYKELRRKLHHAGFRPKCEAFVSFYSKTEV